MEAGTLPLLEVMKKHQELASPPHYRMAHASRRFPEGLTLPETALSAFSHQLFVAEGLWRGVRKAGALRTPLCEVSGEEWSVGIGALVWEGHFGSVPRVDFYRITQRGSRFLKDSWLPCFSIRRTARKVAPLASPRR